MVLHGTFDIIFLLWRGVTRVIPSGVFTPNTHFLLGTTWDVSRKGFQPRMDQLQLGVTLYYAQNNVQNCKNGQMLIVSGFDLDLTLV